MTSVVAGGVVALMGLPVASYEDGQLVTLLAYASPGDGGGGLLVYLTAPPPAPPPDPGLGGIIFEPSLAGSGGHFRRIFDGPAVRAEWWGADPSGSGDSTNAIQHAIDYALDPGNGIREVHLGDGSFKIADTIHMHRGTPGFTSIALRGTGPRVPGCSGTELRATFFDRPAVAVQSARYSAITGLTLTGVNYDHMIAKWGNHAPPTLNDLLQESTWLDAGVGGGVGPLATSRYGPYAGIAIDPYRYPPGGTRPSDGYPVSTKYPYLVSGNGGAGGSSGVTIEDVHITGFVVGVVVQPTVADSQGEYVKVHRCLFEYDLYAISVCNSQSRNLSVRDCEYYFVYTFITNTQHGGGVGVIDGPIDNVGGTTAYQFADLSLNRGVICFRNVYFESQVRFGQLGTNSGFNAGVVFEGCHFNPGYEDLYNPAAFIGCSTFQSLSFVACRFEGYGRFMALVTSEKPVVVFDSCVFQSTAESDSSWSAEEKAAHDYLCGGIFCSGNAEVRGAITAVAFGAGGTTAWVAHTSTLSGARARVHQAARTLSYTQWESPSWAFGASSVGTWAAKQASCSTRTPSTVSRPSRLRANVCDSQALSKPSTLHRASHKAPTRKRSASVI